MKTHTTIEHTAGCRHRAGKKQPDGSTVWGEWQYDCTTTIRHTYPLGLFIRHLATLNPKLLQ